jgi:PEP-CTERM motif
MKLNPMIAAFTAGLALTLSAPAQAGDFIDFETGAPGLFIQTTPLTNFYASRGVTFEAFGQVPGSILDQSSNFGINARSGVDFLAFNANLGSSGERIRFASPLSAFSLYVGSGQFNALSVRYFGLGDILLSSQSIALTPIGQYQQLSFNGPLSYVEIAPITPTWVADDLSFTFGAVPEPATWAMMLVGFGLVGGAMRRRGSQVLHTA